jgi:hypothetical protein
VAWGPHPRRSLHEGRMPDSLPKKWQGRVPGVTGSCLGSCMNALPTACLFSKCMGQPRAVRLSKSRTTSRICWVVTQRKWYFSWFDLKPTPSEGTGVVYVQDADIVMYVSSTCNPSGINCRIYLHSAMSKNKNESEELMVAPGIPLGSHRSDHAHACMHACIIHTSSINTRPMLSTLFERLLS